MNTANGLSRGVGSVVIDNRNAARPYIARRYDHNDENGNPRYLYLGSYATEMEAEFALHQASFKTNEELRSLSYTFSDIYRLLTTDYSFMLSESFKLSIPRFYKRCSSLHDLPYRDITVLQMQGLVDAQSSFSPKSQMRNFFKRMDQTASAIDCITKKCSDFIVVEKYEIENPRFPFSDNEIKKLLQNKDNPYVQIALVLAYTGMRGSELRNLKKCDVHLDKQYLVCGLKTSAGKNRTIPIHPVILPFIENRILTTDSEYVFPGPQGKKLNWNEYYIIIYSAINMVKERDHCPHEFRHTFRTRLDDMHANSICADLLMGHQIPNPVDRVYSHKSLEQLRETIMLLWPDEEVSR